MTNLGNLMNEVIYLKRQKNIWQVAGESALEICTSEVGAPIKCLACSVFAVRLERASFDMACMDL